MCALEIAKRGTGMNFLKFFIRQGFHEFLKITLFSMLCMASAGSANSVLKDAWVDFGIAAQQYTNRGISLDDVIEDALLRDSAEELTQKAVQVFTSLLDAILTKMRRGSTFEISRASRSLQDHLFGNVLQSFVLRQRVAFAVFENYKKWNIVISDVGDISSVDRIVFTSFLVSLKEIIFQFVNQSEQFITQQNFDELCKKIDGLVKFIRPNTVSVVARTGLNLMKYSVGITAKSTRQSVEKVYGLASSAAQKISLKNVLATAGSASLVAMFLATCYAINHRKQMIRELIQIAGGMTEAGKKAALVYSLPETRWKRISGWLRDWSYDDAKFRKERAEKLLKECLAVKENVVPDTTSATDPLSQVLVEFARFPKRIRIGAAQIMQDEWAQDLRFRDFDLNKHKSRIATNKMIRKNLEKAADEYRKKVGDAQPWWKPLKKGPVLEFTESKIQKHDVEQAAAAKKILTVRKSKFRENLTEFTLKRRLVQPSLPNDAAIPVAQKVFVGVHPSAPAFDRGYQFPNVDKSKF